MEPRVCSDCGEWPEYCCCQEEWYNGREDFPPGVTGTLKGIEQMEERIKNDLPKTPASKCAICGTRTGLHGFSWEKNER